MSKSPLKKLLGQKVQWGMHANDDWKSAIVTGKDHHTVITFGEYREDAAKPTTTVART